MATTPALHRLAATVPILAEVKNEQHWVEVSRKVILASGIAFTLFTVGYSAFVFESVLLTIGSPLIIFAVASAFWHICDEQLIQLSKDLKIAKIYNRLRSKFPQEAQHVLILKARYTYFKRCRKIFNSWDRSLSIDLLTGVTRVTPKLNVQIFNDKKQAAIAKIEMAWIKILIENPYFSGELSDLCAIHRQQTYEKYCFDKQLETHVPHAAAFVTFRNINETPLEIDNILDATIKELKSKLLPSNNLPQRSPPARRRSLPSLHKRSNTHHTLTGSQTLPRGISQAQ